MKTTTARRVRRNAVLVAVPGTLLVTAGTGMTAATAQGPAAPAGGFSTMSCSHTHSDKDKVHSGRVTADWLRYRSGPHTSCATNGQVPSGTKIYYHCYTTTDAGYTWTWGRVAGTSHQGWFRDDYLDNNGSRERCY